jgi:hypothetical protein
MMGIWKDFIQQFKSTELVAPTKTGLPTTRISVPDDDPYAMLSLQESKLVSFVIPKRWPLIIYDLMNDLSLTNADLRQAVGHIVNLGNTGHILGVEGETDQQIDAAIDRIETQSQVMFPYSGGSDGLVNAMFGQIARQGALSMEWVPQNDLKGIDKVFMVPVAEIRWVPKPDFMGYIPVQVPRAFIPKQDNYMVFLNTRTYFYANYETLEGSPYAIPPFIAALEPIVLQREMLKNLHKVIKKVGLLGLISYAVEPPAQQPGESQQAYWDRSLAYLNQIKAQVQGNLSDGIALGFKGAFEFEVNSITADARGVSDIFQMNEQQLFSAIQADPAMHGRTYSTTETYASVVYSKMISQLANVQRIVASGLEFGWGLDLLLAGMAPKVSITFKSSQALSNLQEAQARMVEIANAEAMYQGGVIDQTQKSNLLGYPTAAEEEPLPDPAIAQDQNINQRTGGGPSNTGSPKKKQAKTVKHKAFFEYNAKTAKYSKIEWSLAITQHAANVIKSMVDKKDSKQDDVVESRYRRYLQPDTEPVHSE